MRLCAGVGVSGHKCPPPPHPQVAQAAAQAQAAATGADVGDESLDGANSADGFEGETNVDDVEELTAGVGPEEDTMAALFPQGSLRHRCKRVIHHIN